MIGVELVKKAISYIVGGFIVALGKKQTAYKSSAYRLAVNELFSEMERSGFTEEEIKEVYLASQEVASILCLTPDDNRNVILTLSHMVSKGKIMAEGFTSQLSEKIPITMQAMMKATGKTGGEISGMMERGELSTEKYLLPWVRAVREIVHPLLN